LLVTASKIDADHGRSKGSAGSPADCAGVDIMEKSATPGFDALIGAISAIGD
jgi:hypothetical protein